MFSNLSIRNGDNSCNSVPTFFKYFVDYCLPALLSLSIVLCIRLFVHRPVVQQHTPKVHVTPLATACFQGMNAYF